MKTTIQDVDESEIFQNLEFDWKNKIFDYTIFKDSIFNEIGHESSVMSRVSTFFFWKFPYNGKSPIPTFVFLLEIVRDSWFFYKM